MQPQNIQPGAYVDSAIKTQDESPAPNTVDDDRKVPAGRHLVFTGLIKAHVYAAFILLFVALGFGLLTAYKFVAPDFLGDVSYLTWGRTRYDHVQGILFAWLINGFLAFCYFVIPTLTDRPLPSRRLGWILFWVWNVGVVMSGWIAVLLGYSQPVEWNEFPFFVDVIVVICWLGFMYQFLTPYWRHPRKPLYVSSWYIVLAMVFTPFAYVVGSLAPYAVPGVSGAAFSGLWIHDAVGILITPLALAVAYYAIPSMTGRPVFSHLLSMVGFWGLAFFYPLNGTHHFLFSPIPVAAQNVAITASIFMGFVVLLAVFNLLISFRRPRYSLLDNPAYKWVWTGVIFYLLVSVQGALQATAPVQTITHFTDWIIGHAHLALAGFGTFLMIGAIVDFWPKVTGARLSWNLINGGFWLLFTGLFIMVVDLSAAGLVQGVLWDEGAPWIASVTASSTFWWVRFLSGLLFVAAFAVLLYALVRADKSVVQENSRDGASLDADAPGVLDAAS